MGKEHEEQIRIVQETVAGKEITFAHVMGGPAPVIYQKLGSESSAGLPVICHWDHEYDTAGVSSDRI